MALSDLDRQRWERVVEHLLADDAAFARRVSAMKRRSTITPPARRRTTFLIVALAIVVAACVGFALAVTL